MNKKFIGVIVLILLAVGCALWSAVKKTPVDLICITGSLIPAKQFEPLREICSRIAPNEKEVEKVYLDCVTEYRKAEISRPDAG